MLNIFTSKLPRSTKDINTLPILENEEKVSKVYLFETTSLLTVTSN
jgi:hypothetical protein